MCWAARCRRSRVSGRRILSIARLVERAAGGGVKEVVLAVNATVEGQTTAHYITDRLKALGDRDVAARPWRAGRRRTRLSRRRHAHRRHARRAGRSKPFINHDPRMRRTFARAGPVFAQSLLRVIRSVPK